MTFKEYLCHPQPHLDALSAQAETQRTIDEEALRAEREERRRTHYIKQRRMAFSKYHDYMATAHGYLYYANFDRRNGDRETYLYDMYCCAEARIQALEWYARYRKACKKMRGEV